MGGDDNNQSREVNDAPTEAQSDSTQAELAVAAQEKPDAMKEQEQQRAEARIQGRTPSSTDLPLLKLDSPSENRQDDRATFLGKAGDQSFDVGRADRAAPELATDEKGRVTNFRLPDGRNTQIEYNDKGEPCTVITGGHVIEKDRSGKWRDKETGQEALQYVSVDKDGSVTIRGGRPNEIKLGSDGRYQLRDYTTNTAVEEVAPDGTAYKRTVNSQFKVGSETKYDPNSHIAETKSDPGTSSEAVAGYQVRDDHNQVTDIRVAGSGAEITRGGKTESFDKIAKDGDNLKLTASDNSTLEINKDGTWVRRDKSGKVAEIKNSDGEVTTFERKGGKTTATVTDAQGKVVESKKPVEKIDDKDGSYTVALDKDHKVKRLADGTEEALDGKGARVESRADKLVSQMKDLTPEQQKDLKQDLADIDKLPPEKRERIYASLERIAANDPSNSMAMSPEQSRELVASLAHQIAHPESIKQGGKDTCALAANEQLMAGSHPEAYAEMVTSLACDGYHVTNSGRYITAQGEEYGMHDGKTDGAGQRSFASELFQNAAADLSVEPPKKYVSYPPWDERIHPRPEGLTPATDRGERIIDTSDPNKPPEEFHGVQTAEKQAEILNELMPAGDYKAAEIKSPDELGQAWEANGGKPMTIGVFTEKAGFLGLSKHEAGGGASHAVTITHFEKDPPPGMVYFENSAGGEDHSWPKGKGVSADEFVKAMQSDDKKFTHKAIVNQQAKTT